MRNKVKKPNLENRTYYFSNDMINIKKYLTLVPTNKSKEKI